MTLHIPSSPAELAAVVAAARSTGTPLAVAGGGTRAGLGRPVQAAATISTERLSGITLYEPAELVIAAKAGTPLREVTEALAAKGQRLPFEPMDHRRLYGTSGEPTVGGVASANVSGPARINLGAARDSMIGLKFVNGLGQDVKSGGRVMKNVTGLDLVKALAGSFGTLAVFHEVCFKVLPKAEGERTLAMTGLSVPQAVAALSAALGSPFEPTGAAHWPASGGETARTLIRIEGFAAPLAYRTDALSKLLAPFGAVETLEADASAGLWADIRDAAAFAGTDAAVWRISVPPSAAPALADRLAPLEPRLMLDWGGGLVWAGVAATGDAGAGRVHAAAKAAGGYATLVRAPETVRGAVDVFSPAAGPLMAIQRKMKASFDPDGVLNPGRMYPGV
ncbi:FAD-binding protein [Phreatobacter cathodiphilus]|uniref:2-hydroxy-acid oxidase n=1 Tax=Phreatobacter cathodiphilus TaxID=1868589 RepID=A0A2S0NHJ3_9HYPH|nr:FAD-binding protein [Phreatobacter cathodiphilus]AVO47403.1 2-hydroxy-acid oxidase [Phreatobacter cathodiphilus]